MSPKPKNKSGWGGNTKDDGWGSNNKNDGWGGNNKNDGWGGNNKNDGWGGNNKNDGWGGNNKDDGWGGNNKDDGWGSNNKNNDRGDNNKGNKGKNQFAVLIGNYPPLVIPDTILQAIVSQIGRVTGNTLTYKCGDVYPTYEFSVFFPDIFQLRAVLELNGEFIFNNPIWIIRYPFFYRAFGFAFSEIFSTCVCNGQVDLVNLKGKFHDIGKDPSIIDFNKQDFVEFLFYRLGTESRDKRFFVESLILKNNSIEYINRWSPYLIFLPTLRTIDVTQNPLKQQPKLAAYPYITVKYDQKSQNNKNQQNNQGGWNQGSSNNQDDWNSNQDGWNQGKKGRKPNGKGQWNDGWGSSQNNNWDQGEDDGWS